MLGPYSRATEIFTHFHSVKIPLRGEKEIERTIIVLDEDLNNFADILCLEFEDGLGISPKEPPHLMYCALACREQCLCFFGCHGVGPEK